MNSRNFLCSSWILLFLLVFYLGGSGITTDATENDAAISSHTKIQEIPRVIYTPSPAAEETDSTTLQEDFQAKNAAEKEYVGSVNSNKYHIPECKWAQEILPSNQIWFSSREEAVTKGYIPCKVCKP